MDTLKNKVKLTTFKSSAIAIAVFCAAVILYFLHSLVKSSWTEAVWSPIYNSWWVSRSCCNLIMDNLRIICGIIHYSCMKTVSVLNSSDFLYNSELCTDKTPKTGNPSLSVQPIHDKATNCLWIACCGWNPSFRGGFFSSSLKAMNHKNVTNMVWHCFLGLINECSYSHGGKSHTDRFEDFCLALEQWRKASSCVSWRWAQVGWVTCNQAVPLMWTFKFTVKLAAVFFTMPTVTAKCSISHLYIDTSSSHRNYSNNRSSSRFVTLLLLMLVFILKQETCCQRALFHSTLICDSRRCNW